MYLPSIKLIVELVRDIDQLYSVKTSGHLKTVYKQMFDMNIFDAQEMVVLVCLDRMNRVLSHNIVSIGSMGGTVVSLPVIYRYAINHLANSIIVMHNHPSGNLLPSIEDKAMCKRLVDSGKLMDIPLLDFCIVSQDDLYSFADNGEL